MKTLHGISFFVSATIMIPFSILFAQTPQTITPEQAVSLALTHNRDLSAARIKFSEAEKRVNQAWGELMPTIESQLSATRQGADSGIMSLSDGSYDLKVIQANLAINPGVFYNSVRIASFEKAYSQEDLRRIEYQVTADVIKSYFSAIRAGEIVNTRKDSQAQLKSNYNDVQNLFKNGSVPRFELLQAEIQFKNAGPLLVEADTSFTASKDILNLVLGSDEQFYEASLNNVSLPNLKIISEKEAIDSLSSLAIKNRPEVIQLEIRGNQSKQNEKLQKSLYLWPTFFAQGNFGYTKNMVKSSSASTGNPVADAIIPQITEKFAGSDAWQKNWQLRAGATYRWNGFLPFDKTSQKEDEARMQTDELNLYIAQMKQQVKISVKRNYLSLKTEYEMIAVKKATIATAEEGLRIAQESYREGLIKNSELLSAEAALSSARASYIDSLYQFYSSLAELKRETGSDCDTIIFEEKLK